MSGLHPSEQFGVAGGLLLFRERQGVELATREGLAGGVFVLGEDPDSSTDGLGSVLVVSRDNHNPDASLSAQLYRTAHFFPRGVQHTNDTNQGQFTLQNHQSLKTRRERLKSALYLRLKKRKTYFEKLEIFEFFFPLGKCRTVPKRTLCDLLTCTQLQKIKKLEGWTLLRQKSRRRRKNPKGGGPFTLVRFCRLP